jgi:DNA-binding MarR family transcriptional regulator
MAWEYRGVSCPCRISGQRNDRAGGFVQSITDSRKLSARQIGDATASLPNKEPRPSSANDLPQTSDETVRLELASSDFDALKRILASLANDDAKSSELCEDEASREIARIIFEMRNLRMRLFPASMFNEPAWDMLVALYIEREVSAAADLARLTSTPVSTAMRWIEYLESHKLVTRESSPGDRRSHIIRLTDQARSNMKTLFTDVVGKWR